MYPQLFYFLPLYSKPKDVGRKQWKQKEEKRNHEKFLTKSIYDRSIVCVCVCMCMCVHVCMCVNVSVCVYMHITES